MVSQFVKYVSPSHMSMFILCSVLTHTVSRLLWHDGSRWTWYGVPLCLPFCCRAGASPSSVSLEPWWTLQCPGPHEVHSSYDCNLLTHLHGIVASRQCSSETVSNIPLHFSLLLSSPSPPLPSPFPPFLPLPPHSSLLLPFSPAVSVVATRYTNRCALPVMEWNSFASET